MLHKDAAESLPSGRSRALFSRVETFDDSLKYLVAQCPADFISFGLGNRSVQVLQSVPVALPSRSRDVDGGYLIALAQQRYVAHLEYHRRHQSLEELAVDIAEAQIRLYRREGVPVLSHVWDLYGHRRSKLLEDMVLEYGCGSPGDGPYVRCQSVYRRINLRA